MRKAKSSINIVEETVKDISIKSGISTILIKIGFGAACTIISGAFIYGGYQANKISEFSEMKKTIEDNTKAVNDLKIENSENFRSLNERIDKVYKDGFSMFSDFQTYNKKQLELIVDYGQKDKEMLKRVLDVNSTEKTRDIENNLEQAKSEHVVTTLIAKHIVGNNDYVDCYKTIVKKDTIVSIIGGTYDYLNKLKIRFKVTDINKNIKYQGTFDFKYKK